MRTAGVIATKASSTPPTDRILHLVLLVSRIRRGLQNIIVRTSYRRIRGLFWWCTNPIDKLTSFPALNTLSKRFRYARATPSGIPKGLASYRVHQESQHRVRDQGESGSTAAPVVPIDTSGLTFDFSPPTEIVFLHNNPFPYIPTLHSVGLPHPANW